MMNNCPICGKAGLPDFRKEEVVCPACNTNLKVYQLLNQTTENKKGKSKLRTISYLLIPCFLLVVCLFFIQKKTNKIHIQHKEEVALLQDKIRGLEDDLKERINENLRLKETTPFFEYTIKKGDSFCLISQRLYGTEKYAQTIAKKNDMKITSKLTIGNKLIIPQK